ncbi:DUF2235-like protein [Alternaria alternata]|nr:DUF2235-like protein [Alternaria alternata]
MYDAYKKKDKVQAFQQSTWWLGNAEKLRITHKHVSIRFVGVWDTVGALGLPDNFVSKFYDFNRNLKFHDTELSDKIRKAAHALALDEYRGTFGPTMWYHRKPVDNGRTQLIQCWFPGYHAHIGGGTTDNFDDESSIDDTTLARMIDQVEDDLTFSQEEMDVFVVQQTDSEKHRWREVMLTDSASYAYLALGAGEWATRTPGEYKLEIPESERSECYMPTKYYKTNEFIHPSVRHRMGRVKVQPKKLGKTKGWLSGENPITNYAPAALGGFKFENSHWPARWTKASRTKGDPDIEIPEYQLPAKWGDSDGGLERRLLPSKVMSELDEGNTPQQPVSGNTGYVPPQHTLN